MVSADNAHAAHPNYMEKADPVNRPYMNEGIVIKYNANQKYTTDGISAALFKQICRKAGVPYQTFLIVRCCRRFHAGKYLQHPAFYEYGGYRSGPAFHAFDL